MKNSYRRGLGAERILVRTNKIQYDIVLNRRITIIKGDSARGKSYLYKLIKDSKSLDSVTCISERDVDVFEYSKNLDMNLSSYEGSILFLDEDNPLISNKEFLSLIFKYDIWFVFISRDDTDLNISYSIEEVYDLKNSGKYFYLEKHYKENINSKSNLNKLITEDSKSGYQLFSKLDYECIPANGNSNLVSLAIDSLNYGCTFIFDSANFGQYMQQLYDLAILGKIDLIAVESFEYMLLKSSLFKKDVEVQSVLDFPQNYVSSEFKTWENFFEYFLNYIMMKHNGRGYSKSKLSYCFSKECCKQNESCDLISSSVRDKIYDILKCNGLEYLSYPIEFTQLLNQFTTNPTQEEIDSYYEIWRCNNL